MNREHFDLLYNFVSRLTCVFFYSSDLMFRQQVVIKREEDGLNFLYIITRAGKYLEISRDTHNLLTYITALKYNIIIVLQYNRAGYTIHI